nr:TIM-barrel domain-containing protein [Pelistega suis]
MHKVSHSIGLKKHPNQYGITVEDDVLDVFFYIAPPAEILNQFSATIGRPGQPPLRAMGLWLDQQENQTISEFMSTVEQWEKAGLTVDTLNFAAPSMFSFQSDKLVMDWDEGRVGDVRQFIADYAKGKKHICVPSFPGIPVDTALFQDLEDRAWLLLDDKGKAYQVATPKGKVGILDLTYKDAYQYWESRHQQLLEGTDIAVSIAQTIHIPDNVSARQGEEKAFLRQLYSAWLEQSLFEGQAFHKTPSEAFVRRQALSLNSVRSTGLYLQDTIESYTDLENLLQRHLSTQMSGVIAQSHVLNLQATEARLYLRALALSIFSAGFSFVADEAYWPTQFDEKTQQTVKTLLALRYRLIPYVLGIIEDATRTGLPVQRAMALAYPQDTYAHQYHQQFLFGPALLVAPILDSQDSKCIYLPEGDAWWDLNTGVRYEGGQVLEYHCDTSAIPVFGREGHMLCLGPDLKGLEEFNTARVLDEVWLFGMPIHNPVVMRNKIRVMQMQGSSYIKGFEGLRILPSEGLEVKRRGAEVRISRER